MKKSEVLQFLQSHNACEEAIGWFSAQPGTVEQIYLSCDNIRWFEWLFSSLGLRDDYETKHQSLWGDYRAKRQPLWDDYETKHQSLGDDYRAKNQSLWDDYRVKHQPLLDDYEAKRQLLSKSLWPAVRDALEAQLEA